MDVLLSTLETNLHSISMLHTHPTHRLRSRHIDCVLPVLEHDMRTWQSMSRLWTGDGRDSVINTIKRTMSFLEDMMGDVESKQNEVVRRMIGQHNHVADGIEILKQSYETDISTGVECTKLIQRWDKLTINREHC